MEKTLITGPAHFDGRQIRLDADVQLRPDMRLLVTILEGITSDPVLLRETMRLSEIAFGNVWNNEEDAIYDQL